MKAASHPRQQERLEALHSYGILDTAPEADFDELTAFIARACDAPIAVINLVDAERQWFKSEVGLGVRSTPVETSLCAHVILEADYVEIPDTHADPRMAGNPLCAGEEGLRFYAGAVLRTTEGLPLGTLCVLDRRPRTLDDFQRETIRVMANQVMARLELRRALRQADMLRREVDHRVKNSLQSVAAIVRLRARASRDPAVAGVLRDVQSRIETVAALHEHLYRAESGDTVDTARYLSEVVAATRRTAPARVKIALDVVPLNVDSRVASSLGVLLNELISNSLKHAFPGGDGQITCRLDHDGTSAVLHYEDDGVGFAPDAREGDGIGLGIIDTVAEQIGGRVELATPGPGYRFTMTFSPD